MFKFKICVFGAALVLAGCAHPGAGRVGPDQAVKLDRKLVRQAVVYEPGAEDGAIVPEISAPQLRAKIIPEYLEGNMLHEKHRVWILEGDVTLLGVPKDKKKDGS